MILVTGATGFLGLHVVEDLLRHGYKVRVLVRNPLHPRLASVRDRVTLVEGDLLDISSLEVALRDISGIVHAAAQVSFYRPYHRQMEQVNQTGTARLVNMALEMGVARLVYVSSIGALGPADKNGIIHEDCKWVPGLPGTRYGYTKYLGELEVHRGVAEGLEAAIVNPSLIIGPGNWAQGSPALIHRIAKGMRLYPPGTNGFVGVWDVARAARLLLESNVRRGERYVLNSENLSFRDFFGRVAAELGKPAPKWVVPRRPAMAYGYLNELAAHLRGTHPLITLESARTSGGLRRFSSARFQRDFGFVFERMDTVIRRTVEAYRNETTYQR